MGVRTTWRRRAVCALGAAVSSSAATAFWLPVAVSAATPVGTAGGGAEIPTATVLDQVLGIIVPIGGIAGILAILIVVARVIARLDPAVVRQPVGTSPPSGAERPSRRRPALLMIGIGAAIVGGFVGREIARENSVYALFGGLIPTFFLVVTIGALVLVALIALAIRRGNLSLPISGMLVAAGMLAACAVVGDVTARATGGTYVAPVVLETTGTMTLAMPGGAPFVPGTATTARCESTPGGSTVADVVGRDLGELGPGTLHGSIGFGVDGADQPAVSFFIDGADLPDGTSLISWTGRAQAIELGPSGTSGKLTFTGVDRDPDSALKPGSSAPQASADPFPGTLSGTIVWSCQSW